MSKQEQSQITIYETEDGKARIEVLFRGENVWLTQKLMAQLFDCSVDNVSLHLKNIFQERELEEKSVVEEYSITAADGKKYKAKHYSLEVIIALGYKVHSARGTQFRIWAADKLKNYILKGWAIDKDRFLKGSRVDARFFEELLGDIREIRASERMAYQKIKSGDRSPDFVNPFGARNDNLNSVRNDAFYLWPNGVYIVKFISYL